MDNKKIFNKSMIIAIPNMEMSDWDFLQSLRKTYDPKGYAFLQPHFTLLASSKYISKQDFNQLIKANLNTQSKIDFIIRTAIFMPPLNQHKSWYTFLLPEEGFNALVKLQRQIVNTGLYNYLDTNFPFIPHITVGSSQEKTICLESVNNLNNQKIAITGCIEKIHLIETNNNSTQILDEILLR